MSKGTFNGSKVLVEAVSWRINYIHYIMEASRWEVSWTRELKLQHVSLYMSWILFWKYNYFKRVNGLVSL